MHTGMAFFKDSMGINRRYQKQLTTANSYNEWKAAAQAFDELSGASHWRQVDQTKLYDHASIRTRIETLRELREKNDDHGLLFALNEGIHGNMGGMGKPQLYNVAKSGTKNLIEEYVNKISESLTYLAHTETPSIGNDEKFEFFRRASHCFGRSALMLSGGGALGNFHLGVIKVLLENKLLPVVISGASAGAFIAAIVGTHTREELLAMFDDGSLLKGLAMGAGKFKFALGSGKLVGFDQVEEGISRIIPDMTFQEAYKKTGLCINISISPAEPQQNSRLLNAITSPNVLIRSAVMASCAIPGVFPSVVLAARNDAGETQDYLPSRRWVDGSFSQDLPAKRLSRLFGVNHFIVSQVNPAILPLLSDPKQYQGKTGALSQFVLSFGKQWLRSSLAYINRHLHLGPRASMALNTVHALVDQEYTGDINIFPSFRYFNPRKIVSAVTEQEIQYFIDEGERATWPKVSAIENTTRIGKTLDGILVEYEKNELHWLRTAPKVST